MQKIWKSIYIPQEFYWCFGSVATLLAISFFIPFLLPIAKVILGIAILLTIIDGISLFNHKVIITAERTAPKILSLGEDNKISISIHNHSKRDFQTEIIDELPIELQNRDFSISYTLQSKASEIVNYTIRPTTRGEYHFGSINIFISTKWGLIQRRIQAGQSQIVPVYPSVLQMKLLELKAFHNYTSQQGLKRIRPVGQSYEFEQIKNYVRGDDYRNINWKASSRVNNLMVNTYQDERSQQIYCLIDKSRVMKMPFNGLSLMDYAINTSLVVSNIALKKNDKVGLITFSDIIGTTIKAENKPNQLHKILAALYREQERDLEANYELLYHISRKLIKNRSLILLFSNFESEYALERVLPQLQRINRFHLLVVVFFENTEIKDFIHQEAKNTRDIYLKTIAQEQINQKVLMVQKLQQYGIKAILTKPEDLAVNTINKYLELKSRRLI